MFKVGDKVILNLMTERYGDLGCHFDYHNKEFIVCIVYAQDDISIRCDGARWIYSVPSEMLTLVDPQMLFPFMYE
jgi:hypothetical protein